jgi:DNA-binding transcriptional LysR family regulator
VATELRFGGAAGKPHNGRPALSGLICPREPDGTRVLFRVTQQVQLTNAGPELLACAKITLDDSAAVAAVRAAALREDATVQAGITRQEMSAQPSFIPVPDQAATIGAATIEAS